MPDLGSEWLADAEVQDRDWLHCMNTSVFPPLLGQRLPSVSEIQHSVPLPIMLSPEGDVPDATSTDDDSTIITKVDDDSNDEPVGVHCNPHQAARGRFPEQYWLFPYVTGAGMSVPTEISFHDVMAADHTASFVATLTSYSEMFPQQVNCQVCQIEEMNQLHEVEGHVNGVHPFSFAAQGNAIDTPNYWQAMHCPDAHLFEEAMKEEMVAMEELGAWEEIDEAEVPYTSEGIWRSVIESMWASK
eukprot:6630527-Ditylum_brightwellii.AAC.1